MKFELFGYEDVDADKLSAEVWPAEHAACSKPLVVPGREILKDFARRFGDVLDAFPYVDGWD